MSNPTNDGGSISPTMESHRLVSEDVVAVDKMIPIGGLSIRDWFAGMALQGLLANSGYALFEAEEQSIGDITDHANRIASIMISTRNKGGES